MFYRRHALIATVSGLHGGEPEQGARRGWIARPCPLLLPSVLVHCSLFDYMFVYLFVLFFLFHLSSCPFLGLRDFYAGPRTFLSLACFLSSPSWSFRPPPSRLVPRSRRWFRDFMSVAYVPANGQGHNLHKSMPVYATVPRKYLCYLFVLFHTVQRGGQGRGRPQTALRTAHKPPTGEPRLPGSRQSIRGQAGLGADKTSCQLLPHCTTQGMCINSDRIETLHRSHPMRPLLWSHFWNRAHSVWRIL